MAFQEMILDKKMKGSGAPQPAKGRGPATTTSIKDAPPSADKAKGGTQPVDSTNQEKDGTNTVSKGTEPGSSDEAVDNNNITRDLSSGQGDHRIQQQVAPAQQPTLLKRRREQTATTQAERKEMLREKRRSAVEVRRQSGPTASSERREVRVLLHP